MQMTAWFDIIDLAPGSKQDEAGLKQSSQTCNYHFMGILHYRF
jgi:hypothetical protein